MAMGRTVGPFDAMRRGTMAFRIEQGSPLMLDIRTPRLRLRAWTDHDLPAYAALNADPEVRKWWPSGPLTREESDAQAMSIRRHIDEHGFGFWAVEAEGVAAFIGFAGLQHETPDMPFAPAVESGWRFARAHWGKGYATEAARAAVAHGFETFGFDEIVAYAVVDNWPSRRVMQRIGMRHDRRDDFDHPQRREDDPLRRHVLYRLPRAPGRLSFMA